MSTIWPTTSYGEVTARLGEQLLAAEDAATAARERREDAKALTRHAFVPDEYLPGFCHLCRVSERVHR